MKFNNYTNNYSVSAKHLNDLKQFNLYVLV